MELLTGSGLALAAGLNAYIPLLALGLAARFTAVVALPSGWEWLANDWVLVILAVLLAIEVIADKVPALDSANDLLQTIVRPAAGGIAFGSGVGSTTAVVSDPATFFSSQAWVPVAIGVVLALLTHLGKAGVRPVANVATGGLAAPVVSTVEDGAALTLSLTALLVPVLVIAVVAILLWAGWRLRRRFSDRAAPGRLP